MSEELTVRPTSHPAAEPLKDRLGQLHDIKVYLRESGYLVALGGREYVLTQGLVDAFHRVGGKKLTSDDAVSFRCLDSGCLGAGQYDVGWRVRAHAVMSDGQEFSAAGDACPHNVTRVTRDALMRMAETRAFGRTLRLATNVGLTTVEELPSDRPGDGPQPAAPGTEVHVAAPRESGPPPGAAGPVPAPTTTEPSDGWAEASEEDHKKYARVKNINLPSGYKWRKFGETDGKPSFKLMRLGGQVETPVAPTASIEARPMNSPMDDEIASRLATTGWTVARIHAVIMGFGQADGNWKAMDQFKKSKLLDMLISVAAAKEKK